MLDGRRFAVRTRGGGLRSPALLRTRLSRRRTHILVVRAPAGGVALDAVGVRR